jgi:hypothetical protein
MLQTRLAVSDKTAPWSSPSLVSFLYQTNYPLVTNVLPGTGIKLYATLKWAIAFKYTIDSLPLATYQHDGNANPNTNATYNVSVLDVQRLTFGDHLLTLNTMNASGSTSTYGNIYQSLIFDYAAVTTSQSSGSRPSGSNPSGATKKKS